MRRKTGNGRWEVPGPDGTWLPEPAVVVVMAPTCRPVMSHLGRPRLWTPDVRLRAQRLARDRRVAERQRVARALLEHRSVTTAAEHLGVSPRIVYNALRRA